MTGSVAADTRPEPEDRGAAGLLFTLRRLQTIASVLHTAAHPDDESTELLAYLARGTGARVAYLSLNRGEGGQNGIGPELWENLGVIRTEELLAARKLDGAEQYFTRAFDFGFTRSPEETLQKWNREELLGDMVRVIRRMRPLVVVSGFTGTPRDGHGQHQVAGLLTPEAIKELEGNEIRTIAVLSQGSAKTMTWNTNFRQWHSRAGHDNPLEWQWFIDLSTIPEVTQ